jgi:hypothetical protein
MLERQNEFRLPDYTPAPKPRYTPGGEARLMTETHGILNQDKSDWSM